MWQAIEQAIAEAIGEPFKVGSARAVGGGCINEAVCLQGAERNFLLKLNRAERLAMFEAEAAGLLAIRASDSVRAPEPIAWGVAGEQCWLALEFIDFSNNGGRAHAQLGEQLAAMHRTTAERFGWDRDNTIGVTPQPNTWNVDWITFLREQRLGFQLALARDNGIPASTVARGEHLMEVLPALFEDYQPISSLLHGDLWGGNWAVDGSGEPVIFDPAVYFGDRETDIAMTELFGGFDHSFYQAYQAEWPLEAGYPRRRQLYQLYHILNHFNLFGAGYARQVQQIIESLLSGLRKP